MTTLMPSFLDGLGNKTNHKSLDDVEFRQDSVSDFRVSCPRASEKSMNNGVTTLAPSFLIGYSSLLQATRTPVKSWISSKFSQIQPWTVELAALTCLENPKTYNRSNVVTTLVLSIFNGSSSFLQIRRTAIKAWMNLNFLKIPSLIMELATLEHLKN